ncbi:MAG: hypothetical protein ACREO0_01925 [Pseudoxanthomonas sp.]
MAIVFAPLKPIRIVRGTAWSDNFQLVDKATGDPVPLTPLAAMVMRIRKSINGPILLELSLDNGRLIVVDAPTGMGGFRCDSATTLSLPEFGNRRAKYIYDAVLERTAGEYEPAVTGKLTVSPSITRPWGVT